MNGSHGFLLNPSVVLYGVNFCLHGRSMFMWVIWCRCQLSWEVYKCLYSALSLHYVTTTNSTTKYYSPTPTVVLDLFPLTMHWDELWWVSPCSAVRQHHLSTTGYLWSPLVDRWQVIVVAGRLCCRFPVSWAVQREVSAHYWQTLELIGYFIYIWYDMILYIMNTFCMM